MRTAGAWGALSHRQRLNHAAAKRVPARAALESTLARPALQLARQPLPGSSELGIGPSRVRDRRYQSKTRACQGAMPELRGVAFHFAFPCVAIDFRCFINFAARHSVPDLRLDFRGRKNKGRGFIHAPSCSTWDQRRVSLIAWWPVSRRAWFDRRCSRLRPGALPCSHP